MGAKKKILRVRKKKSPAELLRLEIKALVAAIYSRSPQDVKVEVDTRSMQILVDRIITMQQKGVFNNENVNRFMLEQKQLTIGIQQSLNTLCEKIELLAAKQEKKK